MVQKFHSIHLLIAILFCLILSGVCCSGETSDYSAREVYEKIANGRPITINDTSAEFFDGKHTWTIFGATQPQAEPLIESEKWSVGNSLYEILVVQEPISDTPILPFSDPVPNTSSDNSIHVSAWGGEYEPASFVLRSGEQSLKNVQIEVSNLLHSDGYSSLEREQIDVRIVKCWYQAGLELRRRPADNKRLTPELLLHDSDLVRVDYENQVNLVRDISELRDADVLQPFDVPRRTNQQVWLTFQVPAGSTPGIYRGEIRLRFIVENKEIFTTLPVSLDVDQRAIPAPPIEIAFFYLARFEPGNGGLNARAKNEKQLEAELRDMRAHGLTNVAVDYKYLKTRTGQPDYSRLTPVLDAMRTSGFDTKRLLFVDWKLGGAQDVEEYTQKLMELSRVANSYGFMEVFVYNDDEQELSKLLSNRKSFEIVHQLGLKNFVTCSTTTASKLEELLDVAILHRRDDIESKFCDSEVTTSCIRMIPWAYNNPQAGMETPWTYKKKYGVSLMQDGFGGVCNYAYQTGDCWNDWFSNSWRPHVMSYPSVEKPIPTLQFEGFREGIDDLRKYNS